MINDKWFKSKCAMPLTLGIAGTIFFLWNYWTPLFEDDWEQHVNTLGELPKDMLRAYLTSTGRMVPHALAHFFADIAGKEVFNVANTGVFVLFLWLFSVTFAPHRKHRLAVMGVTLFVLLVVDWGFKFSFLWMSGACNYLWPATLLLIFHRLLTLPLSNRWGIPLLFYGLLCGLTNEALVLGLLVAYGMVYLPPFKSLTCGQKLLLIGFGAGAIILLAAPGNYLRAMDEEGDAALMTVWSVSRWASSATKCAHLHGLWFLVLIVLVFRRRISMKKLWQENKLWLTAMGVTLTFCMALSIITPRSCFGVELFALIVLVRILPYDSFSIRRTSLKEHGRHVTSILQPAMAVMTIVVTVAVSITLHANWLKDGLTMRQIEHTTDGIVMVEPKHHSWIQDKFVLWICAGTPDYYCQYGRETWPNHLISKRYGKESLCFLPKSMVEDWKKGLMKNGFCKDYFPIYVKKLPRNASKPKAVSLKMRQARKEDIKWYHRPFASWMGRYQKMELETEHFSVVELDGEKYVITNNVEAFEPRVIDFKYYY